MVVNIIARRCVKFCVSWWNHSWDMAIFQYFQNGDSPPFWICYEHVWTTHEQYLVVFITVQKFVGIDAVVSIICKCWYLTSLAWKCLFTLPKWRFWGLYFVSGEQPYCDAQRARPYAETCHTTYISLRLVQPFLHLSPFYQTLKIVCFAKGHTLLMKRKLLPLCWLSDASTW